MEAAGGGPGAEEGVGESSSPPRLATPTPSRASSGGSGGRRVPDICGDVFERLVADDHAEAGAESRAELRARLEAHFAMLPVSYHLDVDLDKAEDVLIHQKVLAEAKNFNGRLAVRTHYLKVEEPSVDTTANSDALAEEADAADALSASTRAGTSYTHIHEIVFSSIDKPKLLSQLSALLSDIGLNIREAHLFSTTDGYLLDVFTVDGWPIKDVEGLHKAIETSILRNEGTWSGSDSSSADKSLSLGAEACESDIDISLLKMGKKIASGSSGDLFLGTYRGNKIAVKVLSPSDLNQNAWNEFKQEVCILREVDHVNIVRLIGSCTKPTQFCIITEYMSGGSLFDFLHNAHNGLDLPTILKFALDVSRGMAHLHQKGIVHRDLKSANILMNKDHVLKVADFGLARFQDQEGIMTAETGTYRWMAPEVMDHQPYDNKADVYSFAIVLSELMTSKIPYTTMNPVQAAMGVRQGLRPRLPENTHPRLLTLIQRCWDAVPSKRPSFSYIITELEDIQAQAQGTTTGEASQEERMTKALKIDPSARSS